MSRPTPDEHDHTEKRCKFATPYTIVWKTPMKRRAYAVVYFKTSDRSDPETTEHPVPPSGPTDGAAETRTLWLSPEELDEAVADTIQDLRRRRNFKRNVL